MAWTNSLCPKCGVMWWEEFDLDVGPSPDSTCMACKKQGK
jgi:hypothetical protein